jgi:hypothetical protein
MTREDAIDIIKSECYVFNPLNFDRSTMVNTALDMAINALSKEPEYLSKIPYDYKYDTETEDCFVYRHKYTGKEIHIEKPIPTYSFESCNDAISRQAVIDACDQSINIFDATDRIKELPSVKPKVKECEDCVSRKWLKNAIHNFYKGLIHTPTEEDIQAYIDVAPSVTLKPKTGRWSRKTKVDAYDLAGVKTWGIKCQCDKCDFTTIVVEDFGYYKYCPNCGAKMEVEE